uniref:Uncharacterized protein n=1 Tax=Glossina palpalis gambiensis TaxID=67801 RepID=A0A1B0ASM1_9MUSC
MSPAHAYMLYVSIPNMVVKLPLASVTLTSAACTAYKYNKICQRLYGSWRKFNSYINDVAFLHCNRLKIAMSFLNIIDGFVDELSFKR